MSMKIKLLFVTCSCLMLAACATTPEQTNVSSPTSTDLQAEAYQMEHANVTLAEASNSVSQSLTELGATEQAANPPQSVSSPPNPSSYGMGMTTSIDWNGPVQPIVQQIANATHYQLKVLGKAPPIPVIVAVDAKNKPMGDVLRDIGYQTGKRANVVVFPSSHTIELRYEET